MQSRVERSIVRGRIGGSLRAPQAGPPATRFRGLVLPDTRDRLALVDVRASAGRRADGRHRFHRALVRTMTIALMVVLALILTTAGGEAPGAPGGGEHPPVSATR